MMARWGDFGYFAGDGFRFARLPYRGGKLSMYIVLPDSSHKLEEITPSRPYRGAPLPRPDHRPIRQVRELRVSQHQAQLLEMLRAVSFVLGTERVGVRLSPLGSNQGMHDSAPETTFHPTSTPLLPIRRWGASDT